jgi:hypothetical protein
MMLDLVAEVARQDVARVPSRRNHPATDRPCAPRHANGISWPASFVSSSRHSFITAQVLATDRDIGYLVMDLDHDVSNEVKAAIAELETSIRTCILY